MQLVDLTGDGVTDAALAGAGLECFFNDPRTGWSGPRRARFAPDPAGADPPPVSGPDLHLRWADMSGDGLQDLVWLYSGSVTYRPNLGHGVFGAPVRMHQAPRLPVGYNPRRTSSMPQAAWLPCGSTALATPGALRSRSRGCPRMCGTCGSPTCSAPGRVGCCSAATPVNIAICADA